MPILKRRLSSKPSTSTSTSTSPATPVPVISSDTAATILILNPEPNDEDSAHKAHPPLSTSSESVVAESSSSSHAETITTYSAEEDAYLLSLSTIERKVCFIAQQHLESSFDMSRSSGFIAWKNK